MTNKGWRQSCLSPKGVLYILILIAICQLPLMCLFVLVQVTVVYPYDFTCLGWRLSLCFALFRCQLPLMCLFVLVQVTVVYPYDFTCLGWHLSLCFALFSLSCQHLRHLDTQSHRHYMGQHVLLSFFNKTISPH